VQIIKGIDQGSEEWLKLRLGVATASNFDKIITPTGKESTQFEKYALELATQTLVSEPDSSYKNEAMQRGNALEPLARQLYQENTLNFVEEITMFKSDRGDFGYSPDGLIGEDGLLEIKCPLATTHLKYLIDNKLPSEYIPQVQGGLLVSGRKWCDFVSYHPNFKERNMLIIRVERDEDFISKLKEGIDKTIKLRDQILAKLAVDPEYKGE